MKGKPYDQRTDEQKIRSQWVKLRSLHSQEQWSAAVVRAATAAEIAANLAVRREFQARTDFDARTIDHFLRWANGLHGKVENLLIPILTQQGDTESIAELRRLSKAISNLRNAIVHQGRFCSETRATEIIDYCYRLVVLLVHRYDPEFVLPRPSETA